MGSSIFLSHNHKDKSFARRLAGDLVRWGVRVWIDEAEILVGDSLIAKIRDGLDEMEYVGAILSPDAVASRWVQEELDVAMNQQIGNRRVKVLPLMCRRCDVPGFLLGKLYLDMSTDDLYKENLPKLLRRLLGRAPDVDRVIRLSLAALASIDGTPRLIVIVDDNEPARRFHADLLRTHGFEVIEARDTEHVLEVCASRNLAMVVSNMIRKRPAHSATHEDYAWPEGLRLLYALRRRGDLVPFMFLSATYAEGYIEEAKKLMANAYVGREETPEAFLERIETALINRSAHGV
jgi:CheY-like chemotaxis protein